MYIHVCLVLCSIFVMFTCTLVRSHQIVVGAGCETWTIAINSKIPAGRGNKMHAHRVRLEWGSVWAWNIFTRCFNEIAVQVCIVIIVHSHLISLSIHIPCLYSCVQGIWFVILTDVYFRRLKINHDTHEFILESGTIANSSDQLLFKYYIWINSTEIFYKT
jgi:hypothetical protein